MVVCVITARCKSGESILSDANLTGGSTVYVDKHVPVIRITGPHLVYVTQGETYTEFGASVTDTDPNYSDGNLAIDSTSVDTNTLGTYTVVYTADADGAGNEPFSKTRTVSVERSSLSLEATYVDTETILLRFDTSAHAYYAGPNDLASGIEIDGTPVTSAYIPAQVKSVTTIDNTLPDLDFLIDFSQFGYSVTNMGDLNQDGHEDILVGVPRHPSLTDKGGAVAILYLDENAQILDVVLFDGETPNMPPFIELKNRDDEGERFGHSVENLGDVNGDGFTDIIVGTPTRNFGASTYGGAYVLFLGANGSSVLGYAEINHTLPEGPRHTSNSLFGSRIVGMGDLNNDGINDVAVSAAELKHTDPVTNVTTVTGAAYIMQMGSDGLPIKTIELNITTLEAQFPSIKPIGDTRTWDIENMGDLNGDGFTDMMMTSFYSVIKDEGGSTIGVSPDNYIYILHLGENGETVLDLQQISVHEGNLSPTPTLPRSINYGTAVRNLGDVNGDGYTDILISAPTAQDPNRHRNGILHVIFLGPNGTSALGYNVIRTETIVDLDLASEDFTFQNQSEIGSAISVLGDINSDGALDIVVGVSKFVGLYENRNDGQGGLHVLSLAGPDDNAPHIVVKPDTEASTNPDSSITFDQELGKLQLRSLSPTADYTAQIEDKIAPVISNVKTLTNQSLELVFSEDIDVDTEFEITNFRVSGTDRHVSITDISNPTDNTVLLNVTRISSLDEPLVEIFNSTIKDTKGNVIEHTAQTTENTIGSYPVSSFWGYNWRNSSIGYVIITLFETDLIDPNPGNYSLNFTANPNLPYNPYIGSVIDQQGPGLELYQTIRFNSPDTITPFNLTSTGLELTFTPAKFFLDAQNDPFPENYTLLVDTFRPPEILYAETSEGRFITLTIDRYVDDVNITDFSVSDSLSVQNVSLYENRIILDVGSMPGDSTPTVTINGTITDKDSTIPNDLFWYDFEQQEIITGTSVVATDGSYPIMATAEYDNLYTVTVTYSEPIDVSTIDESDFEMFFQIDDHPDEFVFATTVKKITNIDTPADGMSSTITFDRKLNTDGLLKMIGSIHDRIGTAMLYHNVSLTDSISPSMSLAKTINSTLIEIEFNEHLDTSNVDSNDFTVSDGILVSGTTAFDNVVLLTTSTIPEDATPTITVSGSVQDHAGNQDTSSSLVALDAIAPSLSSLSITSNNTNTEFAKSGDEITLVLDANEDISFVDGTLLETTLTSQQITGSNNRISTTVAIGDDTSNGKPTFAITIVDDAGNTKTITHSDITGTTVVVDTLAPVIDLNGLDTTILTIGKTFIDPGTVVIDNDPNYTESATTTSNNINSDQLGSYEVTYSAQPDSAGNVPVTKTRNVTVVDADPITVTSLTITSSSNTNFANEGKTITVTLETDGSDLGNFTGTLLGRSFTNTTSGGTGTFVTTVLSTDASYAQATFSISATNSSGNVIDVTAANLDAGSSVTIDTAKPIITLVGNPPYTALQGESYTDPSTTVSDLDNPSYSEITTITKNLDTSILGAQNITYSAPPDAAGNIPDPVNRIVTVLAKPLGIDTLDITSTNSENSLYATTGDTITITLDANGTIGSATTISIASIPLTPAIISDSLTATYVVNSSLADTTNLGFTITAYNEDNKTSSTFTATNLDNTSTNIIIDKTSPTIVLIGATNVTIPTDSATYNIASATASDLSYAGDITIDGTSNDFDITTPGNYTFTYKAPNDAAGNLGPSITRYVEVKNAPPIGIGTFTLSTVTSGYAKAGDDINFFLLVNNTIEGNNYTFNIPNTSVKNDRISGNELYIDVTVLNNITESNATFTITVENENGTSLTLTENELTGPNIFIDTESPRITPESGTVNYSIVNGTDNPVIRDITVIDGDPKYPGNYTLTTNGTVNADINGSIYNYTYTAVADGAGNPGGSLTRIITIIDADPITVTYLSITSSPGDPDFANEGKTITVTLETDGSDIGNFTGTLLGREFTSATSGGTATFTTTVFSNDTNGPATFSIVATNSSGNRIFVTNVDTNDSSSVIIDTIKPIITLNPNSPDDVFEGESYPTLSATASDHNNASYNPTVTATTLDTSILGAQNITYSAPPDAAGNIPDQVNRIVTVLAKPLGIDTLDNYKHQFRKLLVCNNW